MAPEPFLSTLFQALLGVELMLILISLVLIKVMAVNTVLVSSTAQKSLKT